MTLPQVYILKYLLRNNNKVSIEDLCLELYRSETLSPEMQPGDVIGNLVAQHKLQYDPSTKMVSIPIPNKKLLS